MGDEDDDLSCCELMLILAWLLRAKLRASNCVMLLLALLRLLGAKLRASNCVMLLLSLSSPVPAMLCM